MKFDLFVDGKIYNIELGKGKTITVKLDGKTFQADTKKTEKGLIIRIDKKDYLVSFEGTYISIDGHNYAVEVRNFRRAKPSWYNISEEKEDKKSGKHSVQISEREGVIHPPMPGRVVSIKIKEGDSVKIGSPILVLEAMKMQNEVSSSLEGVVREIRVSKGDLVESGDVLVVIAT